MPSSWHCRTSAQTKGTDDLLRHIQAYARPVIARQIECVLKHWQALELDKSAAQDSEVEIDDQEDDDLQDAHAGVGDDIHEAESIHSWGTCYLYSHCYRHCSLNTWHQLPCKHKVCNHEECKHEACKHEVCKHAACMHEGCKLKESSAHLQQSLGHCQSGGSQSCYLTSESCAACCHTLHALALELCCS